MALGKKVQHQLFGYRHSSKLSFVFSRRKKCTEGGGGITGLLQLMGINCNNPVRFLNAQGV